MIFLGITLVISSVYEEKLADAKKNVKIEYRFVPRTFYEEQLSANPNLMEKVGTIFTKNSPWFYQTVGGLEEFTPNGNTATNASS